MKTIFRHLIIVAVICAIIPAFGQTFLGTNSPGTGSNFTFSLTAGATNLSVVVSNNTAAYSYVLLKKGGTPTDTSFDFIARLGGQTNEINLEPPEYAPGTYGLRISTPAASTLQAFAAVLTTNRHDLRSADYPVSKPLVFSTTGFLTNNGGGAWQYFQVDVPSNLLTGWRIVVSSTSATPPSLYISQGQLPTASTYDVGSYGTSIDTITYYSGQAVAGTYFIGVYLPPGAPSSANYVLGAELASVTTLAWDPGTTQAGTQGYTNQSATGGDYFFAITTGTTADGVWRNALNVQSGQASLYLLQGSLPSTNSYNFASTQSGSNGFVLAQSQQFTPGQYWYILVHATPNAQWNLVTGEAYVRQLPPLAADSSSGATATMGAEGMAFFKTTIPTGTLAWRLGLDGLGNQLYVKSTLAPLPNDTSTYDLTQPGQMLVVPDYLSAGGQYFVGVVANPGLLFTLDSRQQAVTTVPFNSTTPVTVNATAYGYVTFLVQVPIHQIAWEVDALPTLGAPSVAVRSNNVPNEFVNNAVSDIAGGVGNSITLVPPTLSDGTFYVTVYGTPPYNCSFVNGQPVITPVDYVFAITNDAPTRVGWRYYTITNVAEQLNSLGWELDLSNAPPGTEIAIRRNAVPGQWNYRNYPFDSYGDSSQTYVDLSSTLTFLQQPAHPADVWYIGVYSPAAALGSFVLAGSQLTGKPVNFDGGGSLVSVTNQPAGKFQYFIYTVPSGTMGWDLRLTNVTSGWPIFTICRDELPVANGGPYWYPWGNTTWPSGYQWQAGWDWTGDYYDPDGFEAYGQILQMGMGNPLQPGTYYVGVINYSSTAPMSYSLMSRGIGPGFTIPVNTLLFSNGVASASGLAPREAAYYQLTVPTNATSWRVELDTNNSESLLLIQKDALPNVDAGGQAPFYLDGGLEMNKPGDEQYLMMPNYYSASNFVVAGTYYLAVVSQGMNPSGSTIGTNSSSYILGSYGSLVVTNMGTVDSSGVTDLLMTNNLSKAGRMSAYTFTVPPNTLSLEIFLTNTSGLPNMTLLTGSQLPAVSDGYGNDGGQSPAWISSTLINIPNPVATNYTMMVQAEQAGGDASYTIDVHAIGARTVAFDGGTATVTNQPPNLWEYFYITVPPGALGWDVRLTNVFAPANIYPTLYICRDTAPSLNNPYYWYPWGNTTWPSGYQWAAGWDWTGDSYDPDGTEIYGRILEMGMGNPLSPGNYYLGVYNNTSATNLVSYTLASRGIGPGFTIPVTPLAFSNGVANNVAGLTPRQVDYYQVTVPTNAPSWKIQLADVTGETILMLEQNALPNVDAGGQAPNYLDGGRELNKPGNEQYLLLPNYSQSNYVAAGTYYLGVVSQGVNPSGSTIGTNASFYTLTSYGPQGITNLGTVGSVDILQTNAIQGGENALYQFTIPPGLLAAEVLLDNVTASPYMTLQTGSNIVSPEGGYGFDGGAGASWASPSLITLPNPTATNYSLTVQAYYDNNAGAYLNANFTVHIRRMPVPPVAFDPSLNNLNGVINTASGSVEAGQSAFYQITVPSRLGDLPILGWVLDLTQISGSAAMRVRPGAAPDNIYCDGTSPFVANQGIYVAPYLTPGTWYVEVLGNTAASYTLTSQALRLNRPAWTMQAAGGTVTTPGLPPGGALFADTGVDTSGSQEGGDGGSDLAQGAFDYYEIIVPANNTGVLRTRLDAISGNPNLYIRAGAPPTLSHYSSGNCGVTLYDRSLTAGGGSEYGNWVPLDGRHDAYLTTGAWFLAVEASGGSNVRYRLRMDTGNITPLALNGGSLSSQEMVAGDWLYYSVFIPTNAPVNWNVTFNTQLGSVVMYLRDRVPPGQATAPGDLVDWNNDSKNHGPYPNFPSPGTYTLTTPPLRPGNTYYLGFYAQSDSTFSLSSSTNGGVIDYINTLAFYGGYTTNQIPAFGQLKFRIDVPSDATEWIDTTVHAGSVWLFLDQGSAPTLTTADDWYSEGYANQGLDVFLRNSWPWLPGYSYFLNVTNTSASIQPFSFSMFGVYPEAGSFDFTSVQVLPNHGGFQMGMQVNPGWTYDVLVSTDLIHWSVLTTFTPTASTATFTDTSAPYPYRFYWLVPQ